MRNILYISILVALVITGVGTFHALGQSQQKGGPSLAPLPQPPAVKPDEVELGKMLFFDRRLSGDGTTSCAVCHSPEKAWADGQPLSVGYPTTLYFRNTPTVLNTTFKKRLYWDGRLPGNDLPTAVRDHLSEAHFMQADGRLLIERLRQVPYYEKTFRQVYGGEPSYGRILNAVSAYVKSLNSREAPIDRYLVGDQNALSESAQRGVQLFQSKAGCIRCHSGTMLTDEAFHNLGVPENPDIFTEPLRHITFRRFFKTLGVEGYHALRKDPGLYAISKQPADRGKFKTPSLREVARTAPYMHNGIFKTLEEVVAFYNRGGNNPAEHTALKPLGLSAQEQGDLVAFLKSLSGTPETIATPLPPDYEPRRLGEN